VNDQVSQFGAGNIVSSCYGSEDFPNDPFCALFDRDTTGQPNQFLADGVTANPAYNSQFGKVTTVRNSYVNISNQIAEGVDYNIRWQQKVGAYNFTANAQVTYMLAASSQIFKDFAADNDLDIIYSNKWASSIDLRLDRGPWTLNWSIDALSRASNDRLFGGDVFGWRGFANCGTQATPTTTCVEARYDQTVNMHITHDVSVRYRGDKYSIIAGIQNVLNEDPPLLSTGSGALRQGNSIYLSNYDVLGRRFFVSADYRF
jgi:iron complex outermembrane receptor protein